MNHNINQNLKQCAHHSHDLEFFCETCKELICDHCITYGPHQTKNHKVIDFKEAYNIRQQFLRERIEVGLKQKKEALLDQLSAIDDRLHQIGQTKQTIIKDVNMEFEGGILKRLNDANGSLIAILQKDIVWLQQNINEIDDYIHTFEYLALTEQNVLPLLFMSKTLSKQLMKLISIIIKTKIDQHPSDLPRELLELRTKLQNSETQEQQIQIKQQIILKCRQDKLVSLTKIKSEFFIKMQDEIMDWVRLLKKIVITLDQMCFICTFCGCFIDVINEQCVLNLKQYEDVQLDFEGFTEEMPKMKVFGTMQHFFGNPKQKYLILRKDQFADFGQHQEQRKAAKEVYFKIFRSLWFCIIDLKARKYLQQIDLKELFKKYDPESKGHLSIVKFKYLLNRDLGMSVEEVEKLVIFFRDEKEDKIFYSYFLDVDWYLEELRRLEEQLKQDQIKQPKLYNRRVKNTSPHQTKNSQIQNTPAITVPTKPIYSSQTRFSKVIEKQEKMVVEQPKFGFIERGMNQNNKMEKEQTVRSSSLQPKRVQFEDSQNRFTESQLKSDFHTQSRFIESQNSGNYLYKFN